MAKKVILKKAMTMMFAKKKQLKALTQGPLKRKYVPTPVSRKKSRGQTESLLTEMKETMNTLKTLALDTSSKEIFNF